MGTLNYSVGKYGQNRGSGAATVRSSVVSASNAFTTSTSAANVEDASGDITVSAGQVMFCIADEAMRIRFGGVAATSSTGHYLPAGIPIDIECTEPGLVSVVDVA